VFPEYCGGRVLTSEFIDGVEFESFLASNPNQATRDRVGAALFEFYFGSLLRFGFCNCDPHPGNYLVCDDSRVAIVDHGCTRQFSLGFVERFATLTRAVRADSGAEIRAALRELDMLGLDYAFDLSNARAVLRWFYGPLVKHEVCTFKDTDADVREVMKNTSLLRWRIPAEFLFLVRMRVGLAAVLARLGARGNWGQRLEAALVDCEQRLARARPFADQAPRFDVFLVAAGDRVIEVLRELCERCDVSIAEAKSLVDGAPAIIQKRATEHAASTTRARLAALGCTVELRPAP
jgi:predicted unusual protein kinase regulating ubiquinone biosynthesis (AarF/ABC1/UbiB family)